MIRKERKSELRAQTHVPTLLVLQRSAGQLLDTMPRHSPKARPFPELALGLAFSVMLQLLAGGQPLSVNLNPKDRGPNRGHVSMVTCCTHFSLGSNCYPEIMPFPQVTAAAWLQDNSTAKSSQQVPTICVCFYNLYLSVLINSRSIAYICKHNSAPCIVPYTSLRIRLEDHQWPSSSWSHLPGLCLLGFSTPLLPSFNVTGSSCVYVLEVCPSSLSNHSLAQLPMSLQGSREVSQAKSRVLRPTLLR